MHQLILNHQSWENFHLFSLNLVKPHFWENCKVLCLYFVPGDLEKDLTVITYMSWNKMISRSHLTWSNLLLTSQAYLYVPYTNVCTNLGQNIFHEFLRRGLAQELIHSCSILFYFISVTEIQFSQSGYSLFPKEENVYLYFVLDRDFMIFRRQKVAVDRLLSVETAETTPFL